MIRSSLFCQRRFASWSFDKWTHKSWGENTSLPEHSTQKVSTFALAFSRSTATRSPLYPALESSDKNYTKGHEAGFKVGSNHGFLKGYDEGFAEGSAEGKQKGFREGIYKSSVYFFSAFGMYSLFNRLVYGQK